MAMQRLLGVLPVVSLVQGRQCLPDAIPKESRLNITLEGVSMPVGLSVGNWESAYVVSDLFDILTQEVLGYHTVQYAGGGSMTSVRHLAGCTTLVEQPSECPWPTRIHVALEVWPNRFFAEAIQTILVSLGARAPRNLGEIGYAGYDGLFVLGKARRSYLEATGLHLSYYGNYNASWFDPGAHATTVGEVNASRLKRCDAGLWLEYPLSGALYLNATGDAAGVEMVNGVPQLTCLQGKWWPAPACRANPTRCVAVISGGNGWGINYISQQAYFHNMPLALATAASYTDYLELNKENGGALYWWSPDPSFTLHEAAPVEFPPENPAEYRQGIFRTMAAQSKFLTVVSAGLEDAADRVFGLADNLRLSDSNVEDLMVPMAGGVSSWDSACQWLRANPSWRQWVPDKTVCIRGRGLVDLQGSFVFSRGDAVDCAICPAGRASLEAAESRICSPCGKGSFQGTFGMPECTACKPGTMASLEGASECEQCGLGKYAAEVGRSSCDSCGADEEVWTTSQLIGNEVIQVLGATFQDLCTCRSGSFLWQGRCERCMEGSTCILSRIELLPGFFSSEAAPGSVYRCKPRHCPGGPPGTCQEGRDATSVACSQCRPSLRSSQDGGCEACGSQDYLALSGAVVGVFLAVALLHVGLMRETASQTGALILLSTSLTQLVTILQMLSVMGKFGIAWREPLSSLLVLLELLSFDINMLSVSCVSSMGPIGLFTFQVLLIPLLMFMALLVHLVYLLLSCSPSFLGKHLLRTMGSISLVFFIMLFSMLLAPFQCSTHPNGLSTLNDYGTVYCSSQEHMKMFIAASVACLMPVSFLAICSYIIFVEMPRRLARSDAKFLESCSFLVKRFRPGCEISSVLFLIRNAMLVLCLILTSPAGQLLVFSLILYLNFFLVAYFKPWRFEVCNWLEGALLTGMLVLLDIGAITVTESSTAVSSMVMSLFLGLMLLAILACAVLGVTKYLQQKYRKQFRFFLCHQKVAAGCMARLLKMELEQRLPGTKSFIDCDDLNDLTRLFSYVAQDTETFLVLGSPAILTRKWCVGEMVTARRHDVKTLLLCWPDFQAPDEVFIQKYSNVVPDIRELARYGISLTDVEETFRWLNTVTRRELPDRISPMSISATVTSLVDTKSLRISHEKIVAGEQQEVEADCPILADPGNAEAMATGMVLAVLLKPHLLGSAMPSVVVEGQEIQEEAKASFMICTQKCFQSDQVQGWLLQAVRIPKLFMIPVIGEEGFVIPDLVEARKTFHLDARDVDLFIFTMKAIFQEIAVVFVPQSYSSTHEDLELRTKQASVRLKAMPQALLEKVAQLQLRRSAPPVPEVEQLVVEPGIISESY